MFAQKILMLPRTCRTMGLTMVRLSETNLLKGSFSSCQILRFSVLTQDAGRGIKEITFAISTKTMTAYNLKTDLNCSMVQSIRASTYLAATVHVRAGIKIVSTVAVAAE
jgi:hypothetical protein